VGTVSTVLGTVRMIGGYGRYATFWKGASRKSRRDWPPPQQRGAFREDCPALTSKTIPYSHTCNKHVVEKEGVDVRKRSNSTFDVFEASSAR